MKLGFIGTGTIAAAFIAGLQHKGAGHDIIVSPRSETVSQALAQQFPNVRRAASNAEVAASSDIVFLAMRPTQLDEALSGIDFAPHQLVISFIAGLGLDELRSFAPRAKIARVLPLPFIEFCQGPVICCPPLPEVLELLAGMGEIVVVNDEAEMGAFSAASAFMSSYFELQLSLARWLGTQVADAGKADLYVRALLAGLAQTGLRTAPDDVADLPSRHQTKGGLNQRVRQNLLEAGWFDRPAEAFATIVNAKRTLLE